MGSLSHSRNEAVPTMSSKQRLLATMKEVMPPTPRRDVPRNLKNYFLCLLRKGDRWNETQDSPELMPQHLAFLREQLETRRFLLTGPVLPSQDQDQNDDLVGITILAAENLEEAQAIANQDPGAQAGRLKMEVRPVLLPSLDAVRVEY
jgi:uncharacterized protein YciI